MRIPFSHALSAAFRAGTEDSLDPRRAKRIILSNQISLSVALLCLPFVLIYLGTGARLMGWLELPIFLGYASVHRINRTGRTWFARVFLITLANLDILVYTLSLGTATGQHLFFLLAGWVPLVLFDWEERKTIAYGVLLSSGLLLTTEALAPARGLVDPIAAADLPSLRLIEMTTMQAIEILLIVYFFHGNRRTEMALALAGESARTADETKGRFLARMSGSIRAPLEEIVGLSHLLLKSGLGPERRRTLEDMRLAAADLLAIVDEVLDISRLGSGKMRLEAGPFSPVRLGHEVLRPFEIDASRKGLELALETEGDPPPALLGDTARLKQVLRNLVGNACKFTEAGKVTLRMRYGPAGPAQAPSLVCEIEDTGIGIPEEARARLFEPFAQVDPSTTRRFGGTGLGLSICKQIVELMGGGIGFRTAAAGGTIFHFHVPMARAPEPGAMGKTGQPQTGERDGSVATALAGPSASAPPPSPAGTRPPEIPASEAPPSEARPARPRSTEGWLPEGAMAFGASPDLPLPASAQSLRILVVDDHAMNRKLLVQFLAGYGITADTAASAAEALDACAAKAYHLIFLDCHMPGMDGYACARRLRESPPPGPAPALIGVTADASETALKRCLEAGMDDLLPKPILEKRLRGMLARYAGGAA